MNNDNNQAASVSVNSKALELISKMNNKITNLTQRLSPVLASRPSKESDDKAISSGLVSELENLDSRIAGILDCLDI